jgi:lipopolysaccharide O-acetyltransferase
MINGLGIAAYRQWVRARDRLFAIACRGAFSSFGAHSLIELPVRLNGERHIAIGADVFIGAGSWLQVLGAASPERESPVIRIGNGTSMSGICVLSAAQGIWIGEKVLMARNVYIADHGHAFADLGTPVIDQGIRNVQPVTIGDGAWLGQNVFVGPGVHIGRGAVVGANSVVLRDVPEHSVAVGTPARVIRSLASESVASATSVEEAR